jgi:hypothetical protein
LSPSEPVKKKLLKGALCDMLLAMDVGNSNIVIGCIDGGEISHVFRMVTDIARTEYEYAVMLKTSLNLKVCGATVLRARLSRPWCRRLSRAENGREEHYGQDGADCWRRDQNGPQYPH